MKKLFIIFSLTFFSSAYAELKFENPYIRLMPPQTKVSAAFVKIKNLSDKDIDLIEVSSKISGLIELHIHALEEGVMAMRKVDKMTIPAKGELVLKPKSNHLMLFKLQKDLKENDQHVLKLKFSNKKVEEVSFKVLSMHHEHHHH